MGQTRIVEHPGVVLVSLSLFSACRSLRGAVGNFGALLARLAGITIRSGGAESRPPMNSLCDFAVRRFVDGMIEVHKLTNAPLFDGFGVRRPGRAYYLTGTGEVW